MVCDTVKPSLRAASCCSVDVVNGGAGVRFMGFFTTLATVKSAVLHLSRNARTSSRVVKRLSNSALTSTVNVSVTSGDTPSMGTSNTALIL